MANITFLVFLETDVQKCSYAFVGVHLPLSPQLIRMSCSFI